jgi:hypothetical protein
MQQRGIARAQQASETTPDGHYAKAFWAEDDIAQPSLFGTGRTEWRVPITPEMSALFATPAFGKALTSARAKAGNDRWTLEFSDLDSLMGASSIRVKDADYLQKGLRKQAYTMKGAVKGDPDDVRQINNIRSDFLQNVDDLLQGQGTTAYRDARHFWAGEEAWNRAFESGKKLSVGKESKDAVMFQYNALGASEQEAMKLGMVAGLFEQVEAKKLTQEGVAAVDVGTLLSERNVGIAEAMLPGGETIDRYLSRLRYELDIANTRNRVLSGSQTAEALQGQNLLQGGLLRSMGEGTTPGQYLRGHMARLGLNELAQRRAMLKSEALVPRLSSVEPAVQQKTMDEVLALRARDQELQRQGLLTHGVLPGALTGQYPYEMIRQRMQ